MSTRKFKPGLVPTLVTLILLPIFIRLGFWQLDRAEQKRSMQTRYEQRAQLPSFHLEPRVGDGDEMEYRRVYVRGIFESKEQILIDNKIHKGKVGYYVVTPLKMNGSNQYVLINRGWVQASPDRNELPDIAVPDKMVTIHGVLVKPRQDIFMISDKNRESMAWPARMQWLDLKEIEKAGKKSFYPFAVLMDADAPDGYVREWGKVNLDPNKNTSYAMQWFSFAVLLVIIYIGVNLKRTEQTNPE
ncbi:MAG: SURF1 family protein [Gammaproteobacteria bacterium]|nr:SURF1 family protein [Gammaproteobacteria bacterium]MDH5653234.1 SURF1 family protein [Gammaproteobacteria bacterium]